MIDQAEAEEIAKHRLFPDKPGGKKYVIVDCVEYPFGWMFYYSGPGTDLDGAKNSFIVERDGTIGRLSYLRVEQELGLKAYEAVWNLKNEFAAAQEMAQQKKFDEAIASIQKCLAKLKTDPLLEGARGSNDNVLLRMDYLNALGNVQRQAKNLEDAETTLLKAKQLLDEWSPVTQVASLQERLPILESLLALRKEQRKTVESERLKREIATAYRTQREHSKAQEILEQLLQRRVESYSETHPAVAQTLTDLALLKCDLAQTYEAQFFLDRAMAVWEPLLQNQEELRKFATGDFTMNEFIKSAAETMECYASFVLMRQGKKEAAAALRQRAKDLTATCLSANL